MAKNYYEILGIPRTASKDEIRRAYRKLAQEHHPDKGTGEAQKFMEINEAYEVLTDETKRAQYDRFGQTFEQARSQGQTGFGGFGGFSDNYSGGPFGGMEFDLSDIFSDMFGGARRPRRDLGIDLEMELQIEFLEAVFGTEKKIEIEKRDFCPTCSGSGAEPGTKVVSCPKCHGTGQIVEHRRTILGSFQQARTCDKCEGTGKAPETPCRTCKGQGMKKMRKTIGAIIPPGIADGQRVKLSGEGEVGYRGSRAGDLYVQIKVAKHPVFARDGYDILSEASISVSQAALGAKVEIETVDGKVMLTVPAGTQGGRVLRLKGKGVPHFDSTKRGDHLVMVRVVTPTKLSRKERDLLKKLAEERGEKIDPDESLWGKIKGE